MEICKVENCRGKIKAKGYCNKHYQKWLKYDDPLHVEKERHGMKGTLEYNVWHNMKDRCYRKKNKSYSYYGKRGIMVCDRWRNSFMAFFTDMGPKPFLKAEIDRIDNDGNYEPGNCKWDSHTENNRHTIATKLTMQKAKIIRNIYKNSRISQKEIGIIFGVNRSVIEKVVNNRTWLLV